MRLIAPARSSLPHAAKKIDVTPPTDALYEFRARKGLQNRAVVNRAGTPDALREFHFTLKHAERPDLTSVR